MEPAALLPLPSATLVHIGHELDPHDRALRTGRPSSSPAARQNGCRPGHDPAEVRQLDADDDPHGDATDIVIERNWRFVGVGYFDIDTAARALAAAAQAREHTYRRD